MARFVLRLSVLSLVLAGGLASALLASGAPPLAGTTTTASTTGASTPATTVPTTPAATTTVLTSPSALVLSGHGWGHGLGMAQWGAYGYAKHGWTYDQILAHYYPGTTLGDAQVTTVRVLLAAEKTSTLSSNVAWTVTDGAGTVVRLDPGPLVVKPELAVGDQQLVSPLTFRATQPLLVDKKAYRGRIVLSSDGKTMQLVDVLALESYVKGVVAEEMPSNWAPEAVKAQAVATRSYALANLAHGRPFDVYADSRSQIYGGLSGEAPAASAAVDATRRQVLLYNGKVADTLFSSSSGGRTASAAETTGLAVPYLVSVPDPYDTISPYHNWGPVLFDLARVGKLLKLSSPIAELQTTTGTSKRVRKIAIAMDDESEATITGNQLRSALGLRSTWFTPALLEVLPPPQALTYGGTASLTGFVRGDAGAVSLEAKPPGGAWAAAGTITPGDSGSFSALVRPQVTTQYRLAAGAVRVGLARVRVAPYIDAQATTAGARGTIRPSPATAAVELQQQNGSVWSTVATATADAGGAWSFAGPLPAGAYRVRYAPGHGLVAGLSATLQVQ